MGTASAAPRLHAPTAAAGVVVAAMDAQAVEVICYSGHVADEEPRAVVLDGRRLEVVAVERRWQEPEARFFVVRLADGARCGLRQEVTTRTWTMTGS